MRARAVHQAAEQQHGEHRWHRRARRRLRQRQAHDVVHEQLYEAVSNSEEEEATWRTQAENEDGKEEESTYYHFHQGESFGELALLMNYRRTGSVCAVSYVEMCILSREKFQNVLFKFPHDRRKVLLVILK